MNPVKFTSLIDALPVVEQRAKKVFARRRNKNELVCDAVSLGWQYLKRYGHVASPKQIAYYACLHASRGKQFGLSARSLDSKHRRRKRDAAQQHPVHDGLVNRRDNPAATAAVLVDAHAWQATLTDRERQLLDCCLQGETTMDIARKLGVSPGRVSQMRRELVTFWRVFTSQ